jgi:hypothetical protein
MASNATPAANSPSPKTKDLVNKDGQPTKLVEWATMEADSVDDMLALFGESGVSYSSGEEITGDYQLITGDEKQLFLQRVQGKRAFCVQWEFRTPNTGNNRREFVSVHVIIDGAGKFIVNDSSKGGFYGQLSELTSKRIDNGKTEREAKTGVLAERGFKPNKPFYFRNGPKKGDTLPDGTTAPEDHPMINKAIPRNDLETVPVQFREAAKPTWRLEF